MGGDLLVLEVAIQCWEGIIVALYRCFVIYPGGASVEEGAGVEEVLPLLYLHRLIYIGTSIVDKG